MSEQLLWGAGAAGASTGGSTYVLHRAGVALPALPDVTALPGGLATALLALHVVLPLRFAMTRGGEMLIYSAASPLL